MGFTYSVGTDRGKVRLRINDTDSNHPVFDDSEIDAFLSMESDNVRLAAAAALETIAGNEVLVQKRITLLDKETDGPAESKELRELARSLRSQVDDDADLVVVPQVHSQFAWRDHLYDQAIAEET